MGIRPHAISSSGLRFLLRLLSVVAALFVLSVSGRASAATNAAVPMCGNHNESVAAPPIFRASATGSLRALPCQAPDELGMSHDAPAPPERVIVHERSEKVLGFGALRLAQSASARVAIDGGSQTIKLCAFVGTPFRPPRA